MQADSAGFVPLGKLGAAGITARDRLILPVLFISAAFFRSALFRHVGQGWGLDVEIEEFPKLQIAAMGEFEQGFQFRIRFPPGLCVLVVFGIQISTLGELLLRKATSQSDLFYARHKALRRFVSHVETIAGAKRSKHRP